MSQRPRKGALALTLLLIAPLAVLAQQQQARQQNGAPRQFSEASLFDALTESSPSLASAISNSIEASQKRGRDTPLISTDARAVATFAPAGSKPAVRTPSAKSAGPSGGISTALEARSLQDWEVEHFVLLATIDGKIHARDRLTAMKEYWTFPPPGEEKPVIQMFNRRRNETIPQTHHPSDDMLWIVEPTQEGTLYVYTPGAQAGVHKLPLTVRQLAEELAPYASEDPPAMYTASKKSTLYKLNARNGRIISKFSAGGSNVVQNDSCKVRPGKETFDEDECKSGDTLIIAQTEYTVHIQDQKSGQECTIVYTQWSPNNRDRDLLRQYSEPLDRRYFYSKHDGRVIAVDHQADPAKPFAFSAFSSPVVRVFDVARPFDDSQDDVSLIILPQPARRIEALEGSRSPEDMQKVYVNRIKKGGSDGWYAMSEASYPYSTGGAARAQCYSNEWAYDIFQRPGLPRPDDLIGLHSLSDSQIRRQSIPTIEGPKDIQLSGSLPPDEVNHTEDAPVTKQPISTSKQGGHTSLLSVLFSLIGASFICIVVFAQKTQLISNVIKAKNSLVTKAPLLPPVTGVNTSPAFESAPELQTEERKVRFASSIEEQSSEGNVTSEPLEAEIDTDLVRVDSDELVKEGSNDVEATGETPKKKKTHPRGQRGGRRRRKKSEATEGENGTVARIIEEVKDIPTREGLQPDEETVEGDIEDVSGMKRIQNLTINTNCVLGHGSGGTFVFEGNFEGRDVAVKRMLPQYFELASQEVSLLQQSDDHPNVIRYFCQQKDANFLYIAVEKCQSSLWDLYKDGLRMECLTDEQKDLVTQINQNPTRALQQLAAGLAHLHSLRIIHRDVKPQNILIAYPKKNQQLGPRMVISDFGLCKTLPDNMSTIAGTQGIAGTVGWKAPELILQPKEGTGRQSSSGEPSSSGEGAAQGFKRSVDIFSLGCVFFYVLTNGYHPFDDDEGWMQIRELNIKKNNMNLKRLEALGDDGQEPWHLIDWMLQPEPKDRPTAQQVLRHPFFWTPKERLDFLCDVSDHWERECRDPPSEHLEILEDRVASVIPRHNFLAALDHKFIDTLGKQRKYTGDRMLDLLRALRNKKNHYADMPDDVKAKVGPLPEGYLRYWTNRFPTLLIECYEVVRECGLEGEDRFKAYFEGS